jgi:sulfite reductase (NADPH) flavoprotein alpha-component
MTIHSTQLIPESAPFTASERALLNEYFARAFGLDQTTVAPPASAQPKGPLDDGDDGAAPWHDPAMPLDARIHHAAGRPLRRRMMAAMGQQDCGQCGYNCEDYANSIFLQAEPRLNLCVPGGKATARMLKTLVEEMGGGVLDPEEQAAKISVKPSKSTDERRGRSREKSMPAVLLSRRKLNAAGSQKSTYHVEIDLAGTGLDYLVGDSFGILPANDPALRGRTRMETQPHSTCLQRSINSQACGQIRRPSLRRWSRCSPGSIRSLPRHERRPTG